MPTSPMCRVLQTLRRAALRQDEPSLTDGEVLERFLCGRDEAAFEALVRRHGPMVLGVCLRVLGHAQDAEDAFQATFLVLVRKAATIRPREMVGKWLYGVACNTAWKAKAMATKRRLRERQVADLPEPAAPPERVSEEVQRLLDLELSRLPDKYRVPIILCELEGKSYKEAARLIGVSPGAVSVRLVRARAALAKRLARHGLAVSIASLATALSGRAASASVPAQLVAATVRGAGLAGSGPAVGLVSKKVAALTQGVLKGMLLSKLKIALAVVLVAGVGIGAGGLLYRSQAAPPAAPGQDRHASTPVPAGQEGNKVAMKELDKLQGTWNLTSVQVWGKERNAKDGSMKDDGRLTVKGDKFSFAPPGAGGKAVWEGVVKIDPAKQPKAMDWTEHVRLEDKKAEGDLTGIYELKGDTLTFCYGNTRPVEFKTSPDRDRDERMYVFRRGKPEAAPHKSGKTGDAADPKAAAKELERFQGTWVAVGGEYEGEGSTPAEISAARQVLIIDGDKLTWRSAAGVLLVGKLSLDPGKDPKELDIAFQRDGKTATGLCIYKLVEGKLTFNYGEGQRPSEFKTRRGSFLKLYVFEREGE
jgi:RNA polymerase sigma factor (sigma-70 family)